MRQRWVRIIFLKELVETLRDRRTLFMMLVLPIFLYPLIFLGIGAVTESQLARLEREPSRVVLWGDAPSWVTQGLTGDPEGRFRLLPLVAPATLAERCAAARSALLASEAEVVLLVGPAQPCRELQPEQPRQPAAPSAAALEARASTPEPEEGSWDAGGPLGRFAVLHDGASEASELGSHRVERVLRRAARDELRRVLGQAGLDPELAAPIAVVSRNVAGSERMGGHFAGRILPMLLVMMVVLGAFYPAVDLTAGEKERGTLETLVSAPVRPVEIVAGKYLAVVSVSLIASGVNLASMALTIYRMTVSTSGLEGTFSLSPGGALTVLALLVPTSLFFSALMLAVAMLARDFKEAQNLLTPVYMICLLPTILASLPGVELNRLTALAPGVNIALVVKDVLTNQASAEAVFGVMLVNGAYAVLALVAAARLLASECVRFGAGRPWQGWPGLRTLAAGLRRPAAAGRAPSPGGALAYYAATLVLLYYVASLLQERDVVSGLLITEWGLLLLPALALARLLGLDLRRTFSLRLPRPASLPGILLVAGSAWSLAIVLGGLSQLVFPMPEAFAEEFRRFFDLPREKLAMPGLLFLFALSPAICEEIAMRGFILAGLRDRLGRWPTVLAVGLLFGLFHLSAYRFLPTAALGMVLTFVVWQTGSIFAGMLVHFGINAVIFSASSIPAVAALCGMQGDEVARWPVVALYLLPLTAGLVWLGRVRSLPVSNPSVRGYNPPA